jgi:hypothetical protein
MRVIMPIHVGSLSASSAFVVHAYGNRYLDPGFGQELQIQLLFRHVPYIRARGEGSLSYFVEQ